MTRLKQLPSNVFGATLDQMESDLREIKNKQRMSGKSGLLGYFNKTNNVWDKTENINTGDPTSGQQIILEIVFVANGNQQYPIAQNYYDIFFGGTADANRPTTLDSFYTDGTNSATVDNTVAVFDTSYSDDPYTYRWTLAFSIYGNLTYYFKDYVASSTEGEITVTRIF